MKLESLVFAISGTLFGLIVGWVIGSQQVAGPVAPAMPVQQASTPAPATTASGQTPVVLDEAQARRLMTTADQNPRDAAVRVELGNLYFDAERYADAIKWYDQSLRIEPNDPDVSTDLGVSYYYTNQPDKALEQFEHSLTVDPKHAKTLLNMGIVRAFGKEDLKGAAEAWERLIAIAPGSSEAAAAKQALEGLRNAHPETGMTSAPKS